MYLVKIGFSTSSLGPWDGSKIGFRGLLYLEQGQLGPVQALEKNFWILTNHPRPPHFSPLFGYGLTATRRPHPPTFTMSK